MYELTPGCAYSQMAYVETSVHTSPPNFLLMFVSEIYLFPIIGSIISRFLHNVSRILRLSTSGFLTHDPDIEKHGSSPEMNSQSYAKHFAMSPHPCVSRAPSLDK